MRVKSEANISVSVVKISLSTVASAPDDCPLIFSPFVKAEVVVLLLSNTKLLPSSSKNGSSLSVVTKYSF